MSSLAALTVAFVMAVTVVVGTPSAATARSVQSRDGRAAAAATPMAVRPSMCRPEPPDYPGCTPRQVRPLLRAKLAAEYTGHAYGYRYYRMGQHRRGVIFAHLRPVLNAKLARLYREAVHRYAAENSTLSVDDRGVEHVVPAYPRYRTWVGFRSHTTAFCTANLVTSRFPAKYCSAVTSLQRVGAEIDRLLHRTIRLVFSCDGYAVGGLTSGSFIAWRLGTGVLRGGFYGAVGSEIACQTKNLWDWASSLW